VDRPKFVSDAITVWPNGLHTGAYGDLILRPAYQPIFRIAGDVPTLAAWEGLIRPARESIPVRPDELFAHVDEGDALFVECMCRAMHLRNYANAQPGGLALFINVNPAIYESVEVIEREFEFMFSILPKYGLSADRLVCELVEEEALSTEALSRICSKFRAFGAKVALDDFGSGSSGMDRYRTLRPEVVKVDGEMFRRFCATAGGRKMLRSLARTFVREGTAILVEGVEEQLHLDVAAEIGAELVQGYGLARPEVLPHSFPETASLTLAPPPQAATSA
jgi:EAL domain-containing protein (putative c-di-GMP-specific phosphodiesterase class I)